MLVHNCLPCTVELGRLPPEDLLPPLLPISSNAELPSSSDAKVTKVDTMSAAGSLHRCCTRGVRGAMAPPTFLALKVGMVMYLIIIS